jgi:hypothetical protein
MPNTPAFNEADYVTRNFNLMNAFQFVCSCKRCKEEIPSELASLPNLGRYFDNLIREHAREEAMEKLRRLSGIELPS